MKAPYSNGKIACGKMNGIDGIPTDRSNKQDRMSFSLWSIDTPPPDEGISKEAYQKAESIFSKQAHLIWRSVGIRSRAGIE